MEKEEAEKAPAHSEEGEDSDDENFVVSGKVGVKELHDKDADDESLRIYKEKLLGSTGDAVVVLPDDSRSVVFDDMEFVFAGRPSVKFSLRTPEDLKKLEESTVVLKEGCVYHVILRFWVQREIVSGLKYKGSVKKKGFCVRTDKAMIGSFAPTKDLIEYKFEETTAPTGFLHRGTVKVQGLYTDDDKSEYLKVNYSVQVKKDWE
jgi:Rho GDP-dissociation inhibitor